MEPMNSGTNMGDGFPSGPKSKMPVIVASVIITALVVIGAMYAFGFAGSDSSKVSVESVTPSATPTSSVTVSPSSSPEPSTTATVSSSPTTSDLKTYISTRFGYTVQYPATWSVSDCGGYVGNPNCQGFIAPVAHDYNFVVAEYANKEEALAIYTSVGITCEESNQAINGVQWTKGTCRNSTGDISDAPHFITQRNQWTYKMQVGSTGSPTYKQSLAAALSFKFTSTVSETYHNTQYGFSLSILSSWNGYTLSTSPWSGYVRDEQKGDVVMHTGPQLLIHHPKDSEQQNWQDVPVMVFTTAQWNMYQKGEFHLGAAPVGANELGRNMNYVFATPPRWIGFADTLGQNEAQAIVNTFKAF